MAIEKNDTVHNRESNYWASRGISSVRVSSMGEGIELATKNEYFYIGINDDNIDYLPSLSLLREVASSTPIFISTTSYSDEKHAKDLEHGADLFGLISADPEKNFRAIMAKIYRLNDFAKKRKAPVKLEYSRSILISKSHHKVFVNDKEIELTKTDFELLYYLMCNRGWYLSSSQIYRHIWQGIYEESEEAVVKSAIKRLREKIDGKGSKDSIIKNVRVFGYMFPL